MIKQKKIVYYPGAYYITFYNMPGRCVYDNIECEKFEYNLDLS